MKSKALREQRAKLIEDARALLPADGAISDDVSTKFDEMMAAADKLKGDIDRIERLEGEEAALGNRIERRAGREGISKDEAEHKNKLESEAFNAYLRFGMNGLNEEQRSIATARFQNPQSGFQNALGTVPDTAGGYTVPEGFYGQLEDAQLAYGGMLENAFVFDTSTGNALPIPTDNDTSNKGAILGENTQASSQDLTFGAVTLNAYTYSSKLVLISNQLLNDSAFNLDSFLANKLGVRIARILNDHTTTGDGASKPLGVVTAATLGVTAASASAVTADEFAIDLVHSVDPAYRPNGKFMFADSTLKALKKLKDGEGQYLWTSGLQFKEPDRLGGYPYIVNQSMDAYGSGKKPIAFGDFSKYFIRRVAGVQVLRLTERYADYNQTGFLAFQRWDGNLVDAGTHPIKYLTM
ncbi:phage major capsid protein [Methylosinus sp. LW4]|uniref:phage major capsid protein n=1 Tax=Methylosinus sp. LW4 TaxID=136993 RepID=UPI00035D9FBF|nr:phage major capsid protein [Methylosinus sp. LW4]